MTRLKQYSDRERILLLEQLLAGSDSNDINPQPTPSTIRAIALASTPDIAEALASLGRSKRILKHDVGIIEILPAVDYTRLIVLGQYNVSEAFASGTGTQTLIRLGINGENDALVAEAEFTDKDLAAHASFLANGIVRILGSGQRVYATVVAATGNGTGGVVFTVGCVPAADDSYGQLLNP